MPSSILLFPLYLIYRALRFAKASGLCLPFCKLLICTLSALACRVMIPLAFDAWAIGVDNPLDALFLKGFLFPTPPAECIDDTGMVELRFCDAISPPGMIACPSVGSGIEASVC